MDSAPQKKQYYAHKTVMQKSLGIIPEYFYFLKLLK